MVDIELFLGEVPDVLRRVEEGRLGEGLVGEIEEVVATEDVLVVFVLVLDDLEGVLVVEGQVAPEDDLARLGVGTAEVVQHVQVAELHRGRQFLEQVLDQDRVFDHQVRHHATPQVDLVLPSQTPTVLLAHDRLYPHLLSHFHLAHLVVPYFEHLLLLVQEQSAFVAQGYLDQLAERVCLGEGLEVEGLGLFHEGAAHLAEGFVSEQEDLVVAIH